MIDDWALEFRNCIIKFHIGDDVVVVVFLVILTGGNGRLGLQILLGSALSSASGVLCLRGSPSFDRVFFSNRYATQAPSQSTDGEPVSR